jgi:adenylate cyclase
MAAAKQEADARGWLREARICSGLLLMAFVVTHYLNHALGLHSTDLMEATRSLLVFWHQPLVWPLLAAAIVVHMAASLIALYRRRTLRLPAWQWLQLATGLAIPFVMVQHYLGARWLPVLSGRNGGYPLELLVIWQEHPIRHFVGLFIVWVHGCAGLHYWLRLKRWYRPLQPAALALAVAIPILAAAGVVTGGREIAAKAADPDWLAAYAAANNWPFEPEHFAFVYDNDERLLIGLSVLLLLILGARLLRRQLRERWQSYRVTYDDGTVVRAPLGTTLLEASRLGGVPHAAVCGGRGRCSTCRVRINGKLAALPPTTTEARVLERLGAPSDVRLACQLKPTGDLEVLRLMPAETTVNQTLRPMDPGLGIERDIAVLFADLRNFTALSESRLPYDVVYLLNRYFHAMGATIENGGGQVDKFVGDGIMALFGVSGSREEAARAALATALEMRRALDRLNEEFKNELPHLLEMVMGVHQGAAIVGEMGYASAVSLTAVGDTVNVASRLEGIAKQHDVELAVSAEVLTTADLPDIAARTETITIRGRAEPLVVALMPDVEALAALASRTDLSAASFTRRPFWSLTRRAGGTAG